MKGFLFLLFLFCAVLCCSACAIAAGPCATCPSQGACILSVSVTAEVVTPPVVRVETRPFCPLMKALRRAAVFVSNRGLDIRINTRHTAVRVRVNR